MRQHTNGIGWDIVLCRKLSSALAVYSYESKKDTLCYIPLDGKYIINY